MKKDFSSVRAVQRWILTQNCRNDYNKCRFPFCLTNFDIFEVNFEAQFMQLTERRGITFVSIRLLSNGSIERLQRRPDHEVKDRNPREKKVRRKETLEAKSSANILLLYEWARISILIIIIRYFTIRYLLLK